MDKRPVYIICPRCELNYIDKKDKFCQVCKAEMGLVDPSILLPGDDDESSDGKICPICKTNYCEEDEDMCIVCRKEKAAREKIIDPDNWEDDDVEPADIDDDNLEVSLSQLEEEEEEEDDDGEVIVHEDDFEYINPDEVEDFDDEEEEDDEFDEKD